MILGKHNLLAHLVSAPDKDIPVLDCLFVESDGSSVAGSRKGIIVVSPVRDDIAEAVPLKSSPCGSVAIVTETIKDVLKIIPMDKKFNGLLEHVDMRETDNGVIFTSTDGKRQKQIAGKVTEHRYTNYKEVFSRVLSQKEGHKIVLNFKRLSVMLDALERICPDSSGKNPLYIEFSEANDIILRCENRRTGQRALGVMWSYKGKQGEWLELNKWEQGIIADGKTKKVFSGKVPKGKIRGSFKKKKGVVED